LVSMNCSLCKYFDKFLDIYVLDHNKTHRLSDTYQNLRPGNLYYNGRNYGN
jgi:hypothetical protein